MKNENSFLPILRQFNAERPWRQLPEFTSRHVIRALETANPKPQDLLALLSPAAEAHLEDMARRAHAETLRHFGRSVLLFTPLYLANFCTNSCLYCGFNAEQAIARSALSPDQVEREATAIAATNLRRVLALTGDAPERTGADYLAGCVKILARHFPFVGIEVPAMTLEEYARIAAAGADGLTLFQETYDQVLYERLHPAGPKRDFTFRLGAPERAVRAGFSSVTYGALLGLGPWQNDIFLTAMHAAHLQERYPHVETAFSLPRIRPCSADNNSAGRFAPQPVRDKHLVQALTALRIFMPHAGITISTREPARLRDNLVPLGATQLSAGVSTSVGRRGAGTHGENAQFAIADRRSVDEMAASLTALGFQPVFTDWLPAGPREASV